MRQFLLSKSVVTFVMNLPILKSSRVIGGEVETTASKVISLRTVSSEKSKDP